VPHFVTANMKTDKQLNGFLNLYKPVGFTSHDGVAKVRRLLNTKKVGHGGTLDPLAMGVLPLAIGNCTRLLQYLPTDKVYEAVIRFGVDTTTDDLEGQIVSNLGASNLTIAILTQAIPQFIGTITQVPPIYSAVQVNGRRLYDVARSGETIEVPPRQVQVDAIRVLDWQPGEFPELTVEIICGGGTYIRSIARDLGRAAGTVAMLAKLTRTKSCNLSLVDSVNFSQIEAGEFALQSPLLALHHLPRIELTALQVTHWFQGRSIWLPALPEQPEPLIVSHLDTVLGIGVSQPSTNGPLLCPKVVLAS
jgi:tRNA pseudouridine55 synthase